MPAKRISLTKSALALDGDVVRRAAVLLSLLLVLSLWLTLPQPDSASIALDRTGLHALLDVLAHAAAPAAGSAPGSTTPAGHADIQASERTGQSSGPTTHWLSAPVVSANAATLPDPEAVPPAERTHAPPALDQAVPPEGEVVHAIAQAHAGRSIEAMAQLQSVLARFPSFRPALTIQGMLSAAWSERAADAEDTAPPAPRLAPPAELLEEASLRLGPMPERDQHVGQVPANLLQLAPAVHRVLAADLSAARLYLLSRQGDRWQVVRDFYLSSGAHGSHKHIPGDQRTPIGIYSLGARLASGHLPAVAGAAAWPLIFPNRWDQWQGHLGSGIWVHGAAADQYDGLPHSTNGCIALSNVDLAQLTPVLADPGTVLLLSEQLEWIGPAQQAARRSAAFARLGASGMDAERLRSSSVYAYPGEGNMLLVRSAEGSAHTREAFWPAGARQPLFGEHS